MRKTSGSALDPRVTEAGATLQALIHGKYSTATFTTFCGENPEGLYLRAAVDLDDPDAVMNLAIDRLLDYQLERQLPVYLLPVRSDERIAMAVHGRESSP